MTDETTTPTATPITALVEAGGNIFATVTGKKGATQEEIADDAARLLDGVLPTVESKVSFDLASVLAGATGILSGIALVLAGLKKRRPRLLAQAKRPQPHTCHQRNGLTHMGGLWLSHHS